MKRILFLVLLAPFIIKGQTYEVETTYDPLFNTSKSTIRKQNSNSIYGSPKYKPNIKSFKPDYNMLNNTLNKMEAKYYNSSYRQRNIIDPKYADYYNQRGLHKNYDGDYRGAIIDFTKAIEINPNLAQAYCRRGSTKIDLKDYQGAIIDLNKAIELSPNYSEALRFRSQAKHNLKDYYGAISDLNKLIKESPDAVIYLPRRALAKYEIGDYEGAVKDCYNLIKRSGDSGWYNRLARVTRAKAYEKLKKYGVANTDWFTLKEFYNTPDPLVRATYFNRYANNLMRQYPKGNYPHFKVKVIKNYSKAIELNPDEAIYYKNRAKAKLVLKDYNGAIADCTKAIALNPDLPYAYAYRAKGYYALNNFIKAKRDSSKAIQLNPRGFFYYLRAWHNYKLGETANACSDYKRAIDLGYSWEGFAEFYELANCNF